MSKEIGSEGREVTQASREAMLEGSRKGALQRRARVIDSVESALKSIAREIEDNGGTFPRARGTVHFAEVMRVAKVDRKTLVRGGYVDLLKKVDEALKTFNPLAAEVKVEEPEPKAKRRKASERAQAWKEQFEGLAQSHRDTELELQQLQSDLEAGLKREAALNAEVVRLSGLLEGGKVAPIRRQDGRGQKPEADGVGAS